MSVNFSNKNHTAYSSGFISIIGAPNAGKSTLLNKILGEKISITSKKPQTTRNRILGILHRPDAQLIFIDTPGIHRARNLLNTRIVETALQSLTEVDLILFVIDAVNQNQKANEIILKALNQLKCPVILTINKIDKVKKNILLTIIEEWTRLYPFKALIPVSAKLGTQVENLIKEMTAILPKGPPFFPPDSLTDVSQRFLASEMIREKVIRSTGEEIPYSIAVTIENFSMIREKKLVKIHATIHVERSSQKGIIIGKKGSKLKTIGETARKEIEQMLDSRVFLKLFVRVQKNWSKDTKALRRFGY